MTFQSLPNTRQALLTCAVAAAAGIGCAGLFAAAALAPAPPAALPLIILVCIGCPVVASWELPVALSALRMRPLGHGDLSELRLGLNELPETEHPLGY